MLSTQRTARRIIAGLLISVVLLLGLTLSKTADTAIRVISNEQEAQFADHLTFRIVVESDAPIVEATFLRYSIGLARRHAVQAADDGDLERAAVVLRKMAGALDNELDTPGVREEQADLESEAARLEQQHYSAADRKYHQASAKAMWRNEDAYLAKIRRSRE